MREPGKPASPDVVWHHATVTRERREKLQGHRGAVLWFTGLPSSGKSTIAHEVEEKLHRMQCRTFVLDGDNVRHGLCGDLGFTEADREENIRRIGEVSRLFVEAGVLVLTAFVSPFRRDRERARGLLLHGISWKCIAAARSRPASSATPRGTTSSPARGSSRALQASRRLTKSRWIPS